MSWSALEDVRTCGEKYRLGRVERVPKRPGWALIGGNAVHHVTEHNDKQDFGMPVESADLDFEAVFMAETKKVLGEWGIGSEAEIQASGRRSKANPNKEDRKWWLENGPLMVERWKNFIRVTPWHIWLTPQGNPAIELELLSEWGGKPNKGFLDRVFETPDGDLVCVDIKTGANAPKTSQQLAQYGTDVGRLVGAKVKYGAFWMGRDGGLTPPVELEPMVQSLDSDYQKAAAIIEGDLFLASPGMLCGSCSVNAYCKSFSGPAVLPLPSTRVNIGDE